MFDADAFADLWDGYFAALSPTEYGTAEFRDRMRDGLMKSYAMALATTLPTLTVVVTATATAVTAGAGTAAVTGTAVIS